MNFINNNRFNLKFQILNFVRIIKEIPISDCNLNFLEIIDIFYNHGKRILMI